MTRKKAIEIVVANVKMGWMDKSWNVALAGCFEDTLCFEEWVRFPATPAVYRAQDAWLIPRKWLEEKGYL